MKKIKINTGFITNPNAQGIIVRKTPTMLIVKITNRTFEAKSSKVFTHRFSKEDIERFEIKEPFEKRFYKTTGYEVGGEWSIANHVYNPLP